MAAVGLAVFFGLGVLLLGYPTTPGPFEPSPGFAKLFAPFVLGALVSGALLFRNPEKFISFSSRRAAALLPLFAVLTGLLIVEWSVRGLGRAEWGGGQGPLQPSWKLRSYEINSARLRGPEISPQALSGKKVILGLGDSFTFGQGVAWEETFLQRIEKALGPEAVTVNAALPGWNTEQELRFLLQGGLQRYRPNILILQFTLNDAEIEPYFLHPITPWPLFEQKVLWRSHAFFLLVKARNLRTRPYEAFIRGLYEDNSPGWGRFRASLHGIGELCRRSGAKPVFVMFPILQDLSRYRFEEIHRKVAVEAKAAGFETVDLLESYRAVERPTESLRVSPGDWHPNGDGHAIAASAILERLGRPRAFAF